METEKKEKHKARITYFFKETFRAHYGDEYRELFLRGINKNDTKGINGSFPFMYIRAFFCLLILFTVNVLMYRLTGNRLLLPTIYILGAITFSIPFLLFLYELYCKRDLSLFSIIGITIAGGTAAVVLTQVGYFFVHIDNPWWSMLFTGVLEETSKAVIAVLSIIILRQKNPLACYVIAAAVGCGFSISEDAGYIFDFSKGDLASGSPEIINMFFDRGLTTFCTHMVWTGAIGWAYSSILHPLKSFRFPIIFGVSIGIHTMWDFPITGALQVLTQGFCMVTTLILNALILATALKNTYKQEADLTAINEGIISAAKAMGERMRYTNAANLTFALICTLLCLFVMLFCVLPIGTQNSRVTYSSPEKFIEFVEGGYNLKHDFSRPFDKDGYCVERRFTGDELTYAVQTEEYEGYDGVYYFSYFIETLDDGRLKGTFDDVSVEVKDGGTYTRVYGTNYRFAEKVIFAFDVNASKIVDFNYKKYQNSVTVITEDREFKGFSSLIALCSVGGVLAVASTVTLIGLRIKIAIVIKKEKEI